MLEIRKLTKRYQTDDGRAGGVFGVDLDIKEGELFTLLGPSGCGKTTMLRSIAGLELPDSGSVRLFGEDLFDSVRDIAVPMHRRDIGMVFQSYAIWPHMNVFENAAYPLRVSAKKHSAQEITERVGGVLELVGLGDYAKRPSTQLSGGQQQRLALARALTRRPRLLLLDEPLSNLDAKLREQMRLELKRLQRETGVTTVYVTHDQAEALAISDRIAVMHEGRIVQIGPPRDIYDRPQSEFVASFIGKINLIAGKSIAAIDIGEIGAVETALGTLHCSFPRKAATGQAVAVIIRPENLRVAFDTSAWYGESNALTGRLVEEVYLGELIELVLKAADGSELLVRSGPMARLEPGAELNLRFSPANTLALARD
jgi:iron(III) transport system ATP-binding protein